MEREEPAALIEFLAPYPPEVQALTLAGRLVLLEMFEPVSEVFWDAIQAVCSAFCYDGTTSGCFINFAVYANHVTLIFPWGVKLDDPEKRLKGEGSRVRNIRLTGIETLRDPYVEGLIRQAQAMAPMPKNPIEPVQIVKVMKGPKRRPIPSG